MQSLAGFLLVRSFHEFPVQPPPFFSLPNKQSCIEFVVESWKLTKWEMGGVRRGPIGT
jgi:hypothetical protein